MSSIAKNAVRAVLTLLHGEKNHKFHFEQFVYRNPVVCEDLTVALLGKSSKKRISCGEGNVSYTFRLNARKEKKTEIAKQKYWNIGDK